MDIYSAEKRSAVMAAVKGENTSPERRVRRIVHRLGYRFRLHRKDLPGRPDLVFPRFRKVVFVHGCFSAFGIWDVRMPQCRIRTESFGKKNFRATLSETWRTSGS